MSLYFDPNVYQPHEIEAIQQLSLKLEANHVDPPASVWKAFHTHKPIALVRFLKANHYDVDKSYEKVTKFIKWREENNVEAVVEELKTDPVLCQVYTCWPARTHMKDRRGMPVLYEKIGPADVRGVFTAFPDTHYWIRNHILQHEATNRLVLEECPEALTRPFEGIIFVEDLAGLSWRHWYTPALKVMKAVSQIDTEYYPLAVRTLYIINAPSIFTWMWKLVKPWLDPNTAASMNFLGTDFYDTLVTDIAPENIPKEYGGKCDCEGGCLPKVGSFQMSADDHNVKALVLARDTLKVPFVAEKDTILKWEFKSVDYDIGFGLFFLRDDGVQEELIKVKRCDSHKNKEEGRLVVQKSGNYLFVWDNEYSKMRAKEINYKICIDTPAAIVSEQ